LENRGGISIDKLDPRLEELSLLALFDSSSETSDGSSDGRRDRFPESSASTAITDRGSVDFSETSPEPRDLLPTEVTDP